MHLSRLREYFPILQHSWKWFLYYRCQNVNRQSKDEAGPRKRAKLEDRSHVHFCPPIDADDEVSFARNVDLLKEEMAKPKPQADILKELMRRTFPNRWDAYVSKNEPSTLLEYLQEYPLLKKATYVRIYMYVTLMFLGISYTCNVNVHNCTVCVITVGCSRLLLSLQR